MTAIVVPVLSVASSIGSHSIARPVNKLLPAAATAAGPGDPGGLLGVSPRTPRRDSARGLNSVRTKALQAAGGAGVSTNQPVSSIANTTSEQHSPEAPTMNGSDSANHGNGKAAMRMATPSARRWGAIRKGIVPNPALMKVNEKVLQIIQTLRKPPEDRTENDVKLLYTWLMNQEKLSSLFTTMSEVSAKKLCKEMEFLHMESGDVVVNQGDKGNTCFILVSGIVSVYVRNAEDQTKFQRVMRASADGTNARGLMEQGLLTYGAKVATLTPGATFGELCLIEPDSKRSATVVVDPMAQIANFIVLTAASYMRLTRSQTIEGTITDHMAFLQHILLFRTWTKTQLMHLVNSMKLLTVPAGQYITHKGADAESFFLLLRGDAQECVKLMLNENSERSSESRGVQQCVTVALTFLGKFDVAGEYLAAEKKVVTCPVDIRAVTDVDCLVLSRKLFNLHFGGKESKPHAQRVLKKLRVIAQQRETWRETRIDQALQYPNLRVPITRKLMRLSGNSCMICGRDTHIAGDELCLELATYHMTEEKKKKSQAKEIRAMSKHRISITVPAQVQAAVAKSHAKSKRLPALNEHGDDDYEDDDDEEEEEAEDETEDGDDDNNEDGGGSGSGAPKRRGHRLGHRLVSRQWKAAERAGLQGPKPAPQRPQTTPGQSGRPSRFMSITHTQHISKRKLLEQQQQQSYSQLNSTSDPLAAEIRRIRESWPYGWRDLEPVDTTEPLPHFERLYRNAARPKSPEPLSLVSSPRSATTRKKPHTAR